MYERDDNRTKNNNKTKTKSHSPLLIFRMKRDVSIDYLLCRKADIDGDSYIRSSKI